MAPDKLINGLYTKFHQSFFSYLMIIFSSTKRLDSKMGRIKQLPLLKTFCVYPIFAKHNSIGKTLVTIKYQFIFIHTNILQSSCINNIY